MLDHYNYKNLYKCVCVLCKRCRTSQVRYPKTPEDVEISKQWKLRRIIFCELSYLLKDYPDDIKTVWSIMIEKENWNPCWYKMSLMDILQDIKDIEVKNYH